jgi:serine/threonine protein kinase
MDEEISLTELGIEWRGSPRLWKTIDKKLIPVSNALGEIKDASGRILAQINKIDNIGEGQYGIIERISRRTPDKEVKYVALKRENENESELVHEALFQWLLQKKLAKFGLSHCVPKVYDIFRFHLTNKVMFTMEHYKADLMSNWCVKHITKNDPKLFIQLLLQIALILYVFDTKLFLNHRDLKLNNILVETKPTILKLTKGGFEHIIEFPFRIIIIDFGLLCIKEIIDLPVNKLGTNLPLLDPCPKVGRDIFQVLVSLWNISTLRSFLNKYYGNWVRERLHSGGKDCSHKAENFKGLKWMYDKIFEEQFQAPLCAPEKIIDDCIEELERE